MAPLQDCPFCGVENSILSNERTYAVFDRTPVAPGHFLTIPHRHAGRLARVPAASMPDPFSRIRPEPLRLVWASGWLLRTHAWNLS